MKCLKLSHLYQKVKKTVEKYDLLSPGDKVLLAVSGGPDSVCMLDVMVELAVRFDLRLEIFHLNHLARPSADRDELFVRNLARALNLGLTVKQEDAVLYSRRSGCSFQDGARKLRYELMEETACLRGLNKIATAHTKDDLVETFIMRVIGGSDLRGLSGIPPKRENKIIRPLIECSKEEIFNYLTEEKIDFMVDESNASDKYARNRVRNHLTPVLSEDRDEIGRIIFETNELIREQEGRLRHSVDKLYNDNAVVGGHEVLLPVEMLKSVESAVGLRLLIKAVAALSGDNSRNAARGGKLAWDTFQKGFIKRLDIPGGLSVCQENDQVVICRAMGEGIELISLQVGLNQQIKKNLNIEIIIVNKRNSDAAGNHKDLALIDADKVKWPLAVRSFEPGDRFVPLGMSGRKKVKDFFIDKKIPKRLRGEVPIIVDREKIVWIAGERLDNRVKVDDGTKKVAVLKITARE